LVPFKKAVKGTGTSTSPQAPYLTRTIHQLLYTAMKSLMDMDPELYNKCEEDYEHSCLEAHQQTLLRQERWKLLSDAAHQVGDTNHVGPAMQVDILVNTDGGTE
jgi:Protein phosphatase 2A regulatory B subunit (B56 family)